MNYKQFCIKMFTFKYIKEEDKCLTKRSSGI